MANARPTLDTLAVPDANPNRRTGSFTSEEVSNLYPTGIANFSGNDVGVSLPEADALGHIFDAPIETPARGGWLSRPSPWIVYPLTFLSATVYGAMMGPRTELLVQLACAYHRPEYYAVLPPGIPDMTWSSVSRMDSGPFPVVHSPMRNPKCSTDPVVLAAVAKIVTVTVLIVGVLTVLTTGWWGQLSDRRGRKFVLGFTVFAVFVSDLNMILVSKAWPWLPGGYWFLVVSSFTDGMLGGLQTAGAATHAYVSDCTEPSERARAFSLYLGFVFVGFGLGPTIGSLLVKLTEDLLTPFYLGLLIHLCATLFIWLLMPESLDRKTMMENRQNLEEARRQRSEAMQRSKADGTWREWYRLSGWLKEVFGPLALFVPRRRMSSEPGHGKRNWNLTLLGTAHCIMMSFISLGSFNQQYAIANFGWTAVEIGYWMSLIGVSRAAFLLVVLPVITKIFKPKATAGNISLPTQGDASPLLRSREPSPTPERDNERSRSPSPFPVPGKTTLPPRIAARFDVKIARGSLLVEILTFVVLLGSIGAKSWMWATVCGSFAAGFSPSIQSLALYLSMDPGQNGKLFGSLAVAAALGSQVLGPALYGTIYVNTVATFPKTIYAAALGATFVSGTLLALIRLPKEVDHVETTFEDPED